MRDDRSSEADALLRVLAPKLERLRQRLIAANEELKGANADEARLLAVTQSQLALKEFLLGIASFRGLVEPIDFLLRALTEEPPHEEAQPTPPEPAPPPDPAPIEAVPAPEPIVIVAEAKPAPAPRTKKEILEGWIQNGLGIAVDKLVKGGMTATSAEAFVEQACADAGLTLTDGTPISATLIGSWRRRNAGPTQRGRRSLEKALSGRNPTFEEVKPSVRELVLILKRIRA